MYTKCFFKYTMSGFCFFFTPASLNIVCNIIKLVTNKRVINFHQTRYILELYNKYKHNIKSGNMFLPADIQEAGTIFRADTNLFNCFVFFLSHLCLLLINSRLLMREGENHLQLTLTTCGINPCARVHRLVGLISLLY